LNVVRCRAQALTIRARLFEPVEALAHETADAVGGVLFSCQPAPSRAAPTALMWLDGGGNLASTAGA